MASLELTQEMIDEYNAGNERTIQYIYDNTERFLHYMCVKWQGLQSECPSLNHEELYGLATLSLVKSIKTFKPENGVKFITYLSRVVTNEFLMRVRREKKHYRNIDSMDKSLKTDESGKELLLGDVLSDNSDITENIQLSELVQAVKEFMNDEPKGNLLTGVQAETADRLGVSQSYISRLRRKQRTKLIKYLYKKGLIDSVEETKTQKRRITKDMRASYSKELKDRIISLILDEGEHYLDAIAKVKSEFKVDDVPVQNVRNWISIAKQSRVMGSDAIEEQLESIPEVSVIDETGYEPEPEPIAAQEITPTDIEWLNTFDKTKGDSQQGIIGLTSYGLNISNGAVKTMKLTPKVSKLQIGIAKDRMYLRQDDLGYSISQETVGCRLYSKVSVRVIREKGIKKQRYPLKYDDKLKMFYIQVDFINS